MNIHKITPSIDSIYLFKDPKVVKPTNKKSYFKTLGFSVINSPTSTLWKIITPQPPFPLLLTSVQNQSSQTRKLSSLYDQTKTCKINNSYTKVTRGLFVYVYVYVCTEGSLTAEPIGFFLIG